MGQQSEEDAVDEEEEEEKEGEEEIPVIEEDFNVDQYDEEAELVPTDIDETTNDVTSRKMRLKEKPKRNLTELMQLRQWRIFSKFRSHLLIFLIKCKKYKMISELIITHISIQ